MAEQKKTGPSKGGNSKKKPQIDGKDKRERERKRKAEERSLKRASSVQTPNVPLLTYSQWELFETLTNGKNLSYSYSLINIQLLTETETWIKRSMIMVMMVLPALLDILILEDDKVFPNSHYD